jgi:F-type H+-transporting ATPase subunit b
MRKLLLTIIVFLILAALPAIASEETPEGGQPNVFSGDFADALWTVISFVLLLAVLVKFAWKPILNGLKERQEHIEQEIKAAENTKKQAETLLDDYKQRGTRIIEDSTAAAQQSQRELIEETRRETQLIRQRAQDDVRHAMMAASQKLWNEAADMMLMLGKDVLGRTITAEDNEHLVREAIEKIRSSRADTAK